MPPTLESKILDPTRRTATLLTLSLALLAIPPSIHAAPLFEAPYLMYEVGASPFSVAIADLNGDGRQDVAVTHGGDGGLVSVLMGRGDGTFDPPRAFPAGRLPQVVKIADLNGDG